MPIIHFNTGEWILDAELVSQFINRIDHIEDIILSSPDLDISLITNINLLSNMRDVASTTKMYHSRSLSILYGIEQELSVDINE